ncbi:MAG: 4-(cytidine 5'-diphospho)-2-C-methyl-D-erythritol kinase [Elusimicrobiales bacterium]
MRKITLAAPAKINLFLEITGKRPDGYHNIATLFAKISLADKITIAKSGKPGFRLINRTPCPLSAGADNLALRAEKAVREEFGINGCTTITLEKNIPIGAGLGGGSSDAAAVIKGMCRLFGITTRPWENRRLSAIARGLGADVPVFLREEAFLVGTGIGDRLKPLPARGRLPYLTVVYPGVPVSTADAYRALRPAPRTEVLTRLLSLYKLKRMLEGGAASDNWISLLFNRLEQPVLPRYKAVRDIRAELAAHGAKAVLMSGSGSCVFAISDTAAQSKRIAAAVAGGRAAAYAVKFLRGEYADKRNPHPHDE